MSSLINTTENGAVIRIDAVIIGAGFAGLYALKKMRDELGLTALAFDKAGGVGGTWYWNRYPGALSDSESHVYCYSWDKDLLQEWDFKTKYVPQSEVLRYLESVAQRHDLLKDIRLNTGITAAAFDEAQQRWIVLFGQISDRRRRSAFRDEPPQDRRDG
jgi:cyclohexanone monooxygenase